jgi:hypothetical protein
MAADYFTRNFLVTPVVNYESYSYAEIDAALHTPAVGEQAGSMGRRSGGL